MIGIETLSGLNQGELVSKAKPEREGTVEYR